MTIAADGSVERRPFTRLREELLELAREQRPYDEAVAREYRERLTEAVRLRLQSEVPVGTSLSGGLDSSAVAVIINRLLNEHDRTAESVGPQQNTFSAIFPDSRQRRGALRRRRPGDLPRPRSTGTRSSRRPTEFKEDLADFVRTQEEPLVSTGPYAQYQRAAGRGSARHGRCSTVMAATR